MSSNMRLLIHITIGLGAFLLGVLSVWITPPASDDTGPYLLEAPAGQMATTPAPDAVLPEIVSAIPDIEVVGAEEVYDSFGTAHIALDLRNNSDQDVTSLYVESHTCRTGGAQGWSQRAGRPVIRAHETRRWLFDWDNVIPGQPLTVNFVKYADGTTAGTEYQKPTGCKCSSDEGTREPDQAQ